MFISVHRDVFSQDEVNVCHFLQLWCTVLTLTVIADCLTLSLDVRAAVMCVSL